MKFRFSTLTQKQLGLLFGVSSHKIGEWLTEIGLRNDQTKRPTNEAHYGRYCEQAPSGQCGYHWVWRSQPTVDKLLAAGHRLVLELPESIVEPPFLNGPFTISITNPKAVMNSDGSLAALTTSIDNAKVLLCLLCNGHRYGLERLLTSKASS